MGDHALNCAAMGSYSRHNALREALFAVATDCGISCRREAAIPDEEGALRPADILLEPFVDGVVTAVDVSVVNPLHPPFSQAMAQPGLAAETRQLQKVALYKSACAEANWSFVPVVVETTGAWGVVGQKLVGKLVRLLSQHRGINIQASSREVWDRLATVVARHVASQLSRAFPLAHPTPEVEGSASSGENSCPSSSFTEQVAHSADLDSHSIPRVLYIPSGRVGELQVTPIGR